MEFPDKYDRERKPILPKKKSQFCQKKSQFCTKRPMIITRDPSFIAITSTPIMTFSLSWIPPGFELGSLAPETSVLSIAPRCRTSMMFSSLFDFEQHPSLAHYNDLIPVSASMATTEQ